MEPSDKGKIYNLLEEFRLQNYYNKFLELGVLDVKDFKDSVTLDDLTALGLTQVEKNRFQKLTDRITQLWSGGSPVMKSPQAYCIKYRFPKCREVKTLGELDPNQNTVEDLKLRIRHQEEVEAGKDICLYTKEGVPLTDDPFFNTWSLRERHLNKESEVYVIFTEKHNIKHIDFQPVQLNIPDSMLGEHTLYCYVMLKV
ncbi:uncharacterized protein LOC135359275 [Latimeria chalumnae]|uniref:uncharacterized protein LOC135359275 n=1 Tax=Latimeria chalumnae TaxID=7897 RepID=UPI00313E25B6